MRIQRLDIFQRETFVGKVSQGKEAYADTTYATKVSNYDINDAFCYHFDLDLNGDTYVDKDCYFYEFSKFGLSARYYFVISPYDWDFIPPKVWAEADRTSGQIVLGAVGPDWVNSGDLKYLGRNTGLTMNNRDLAWVYKGLEGFSWPVNTKLNKLFFGHKSFYLTEATSLEIEQGKLPDLEKVINPSTTESHPDNNYHENGISMMVKNRRTKPHYQPSQNNQNLWGGFFGGVYLGGGFDNQDK